MSERGTAQQPRFRGPCPGCGLETALNADGSPITNHVRGRIHGALMAKRGEPVDAKRIALSKPQERLLASIEAGGAIEPEGRDARNAKALRAKGLARHIGKSLTDITTAGREWLAGEKA